MTNNIIGEEFQPYVKDQIKSRQERQGTGLSSPRSIEDINYLSNRTPWIKMASSISIEGDEGISKLKRMFGIESVEKYAGDKLAKKSILFKSLSEATFDKNNKFTGYNIRKGVTQTSSIWTDSLYGLGGSGMGLQPPPGITSISIDTVNMGSVRKATVELKAFNKFQFELLDMIYLRIGFSVLLEWGWDKYIDDIQKKKITNVGNTLIENYWFNPGKENSISNVLSKIEETRKKYCGNYDGFFGKVVNYSWKFDTDGSYNITLSLITMGDVIESLKTNIPSTNESSSQQIGSPSIIENFLKQNLPGNLLSGLDANNYFSVSQATLDNIYKTQLTGVQTSQTNLNKQRSTSYDNIQPDKDAALYSNYMTFGELLKLVKNNIIPIIKNGPNEEKIIIVDHENILYTKAFPNQISIDPRICFFRPLFYADDFVEVNAGYGAVHKNYLTTVGADKLVFGNLTNLYINYDFILKSLKNNIGSNNNMSVYRFLENICNGINDALGGVNKIHPILKNDIELTFIDQALQSSPVLKNELTKTTDVASIEVYGYNKTNSTSNFVTNVSFETKLNKDTSTLMSIGATAGGGENAIKNGDATLFSKWSDGLVDRFHRSIIDANENEIDNSNKYTKTLWSPTSSFTALDLQHNPQYASIVRKYKPNSSLNLKHSPYSQGYINYDNIAALVGEYVKTPPSESLTLTPEQLIARDVAIIEKNKDKQAYEDAKATNPDTYSTDVETAYLAYVVELFSGSTKPKSTNSKSISYSVEKGDEKYFWFNSDLIEKGKILYKSYIAFKAQQEYSKTKNPSSSLGYLPLVLNLTLDGISGIKIYNKLNISQDFLPSTYPESFNFVISKLNHKVDSSGWDTQIGTIVTSGIDDSKVKYYEGNNLNVKLTSTATPAGAVPMSEAESIKFLKDVLTFIGIPNPNQYQLQMMKAWRQHEGSTATYNPFNTTRRAEGATDFNSVGVKNYINWQQGLYATTQTLKQANFSTIVSSIKNIKTTDDISKTMVVINNSAWGSNFNPPLASAWKSFKPIWKIEN